MSPSPFFASPSSETSCLPSYSPTLFRSFSPVAEPSDSPIYVATIDPTISPTTTKPFTFSNPTQIPSQLRTGEPSIEQSHLPTGQSPDWVPTMMPTLQPSLSENNSLLPSSMFPTLTPLQFRTLRPSSTRPSGSPLTSLPTALPSIYSSEAPVATKEDPIVAFTIRQVR